MLSKNQIKEIQSLQIKKFRDARRLFIAEGIKTVLEIMTHRPASIKSLFATRDFLDNNLEKINSLNLNFTEITETELKKISLQNSPNRVLAICNYFEENSGSFDFENNFTFYLDDVRDPGNMGTIVRLAGWFGIATVFCSPGSCDFYNPKVIQSTMGAFLRVKVVYVELSELVIRDRVKPVFGALLNGKNIYKEKLVNGLIVIGNEANGINEDNLKLITDPITIPAALQNNTESLNAAMATSIIGAEFFRQLKL